MNHRLGLEALNHTGEEIVIVEGVVPDDVVIRRYQAGLANMRSLYMPLADIAAIYDNSDEGRTLIAERTPDAPFIVYDPYRWAMIERTTQ